MYSYVYNKSTSQQFTSNSLINTRGEDCKDNDMTSCCPHMPVNEKGQYSATNELSPFEYNEKTYELHTCCLACAEAMSSLSEEEFEERHLPIIQDDYLLIHHRETKKLIQKMKEMSHQEYGGCGSHKQEYAGCGHKQEYGGCGHKQEYGGCGHKQEYAGCGHKQEYAGCGGHKQEYAGCGGHKQEYAGCGGHKQEYGGCGSHKQEYGGCGGHKQEYGGCGGHKQEYGGCGGHKQEYESIIEEPIIEEPMSEEQVSEEQVSEEQGGQLTWKYPAAISAYNDITNRFGPANAVAPEEGGVAIWDDIIGAHDPFYKRVNVFDKIEIRDEAVAHACPSAHNDFLYSYIKIPITPSQLEKVNQLTGSVNYDMLKKELFARCAHTCANVVTLYLATEIILHDLVLNGKIEPTRSYTSIGEIHKSGLYGKMINNTHNLEFTQKLYDRLAANIHNIKKSQSLPSDFWPGAFSDNCGIPN